MFTSGSGRREVLSLLNCYGITKVYPEVYRSGLVISPEVIKESVEFLKENGFEVIICWLFRWFFRRKDKCRREEY
jgi:hypothetical protein